MIAHLLGDFVFQSNTLIKEKYKSWKGTFKHSLIILAFTALLLFPYWLTARAWIVILAIFITHFVQDYLKVEYDKRHNKKKSPAPFFVDQASHLLLIILLGRGFEEIQTLALPEWISTLYFSQTFAVLFVSMILLSYVLDITKYQFKRSKHRKLIYHADYIGMLHRIWAFTIFYLIAFLIYNFWLIA